MLVVSERRASACLIMLSARTSLSQWETDWQMKFNVAKCHSMRVTRHLPDKQILFDYTLHQQKLEQVQSAKYLGLTITDNLDWGQHVSEILCKATKTMGFLRRNLALAPRRGTDKTPLGQNPTGQNPTGQNPTPIFGRADKTPLLHKKGFKNQI